MSEFVSGWDPEDPPFCLMHDILEDAAALRPSAGAVRDPDGAWSYAELDQLSRAVAGWLRDWGVRRGDRVLVRLPNVRHVVPLLFGLSRLGAVFVPINPAMKEFHLRSVTNDSEPVLAIVDNGHSGDVGGVPTVELGEMWRQVEGRPQREFFDPVRTSGDRGQAGGLSEESDVRNCRSNSSSSGLCPHIECNSPEPEDTAIFIYTSGSTAAPKAVVLPQAPVTFAAQAIQAVLGYRHSDVVFCRLPLSFDYGLYQILLSALAGAELVLAADLPEFRLLSQIRDAGATVFPAVPSLATAVVKLVDRDPRPTLLRMVTNTGAALPQAVIDGLRAGFPDATVVRMYGTTECKRITIMPPEEEFGRPDSVGRALPGTRVLILDAEGEELPPGETGEIGVTGPHVMAGYWKLAELTDRTFRVTDAGEVRLHTGDYGHLDADGYLYFAGRRDDMFKRKGTRMSSIEIEAAAMDIPGVRAAAVLPPDGDRDLTIFVAADIAPTAVLRELAKRLEPAKVPALCKVLAEFPLTPNGKNAKKQLSAMLEEAA